MADRKPRRATEGGRSWFKRLARPMRSLARSAREVAQVETHDAGDDATHEDGVAGFALREPEENSLDQVPRQQQSWREDEEQQKVQDSCCPETCVFGPPLPTHLAHKEHLHAPRRLISRPVSRKHCPIIVFALPHLTNPYRTRGQDNGIQA